jgi:BirA family transcriptional regulator, biotin operon repressor / biotin---[acetyl-CoA-carboxylase] ligase
LPSDADAVTVPRYDGLASADLARRLSVPRLELFDEVASTQDVAHALGAAGAPAGTLVLADAQRSGRGRQGRAWRSDSGAGVWMTLLERPSDASALDVMSLRLGLHAARVLDRWASSTVRLKWPNDLFVAGGKLAGILVEARWRESRVDWVAIGVGLNVSPPPGIESAAALRPGTSRLDVLQALVPALRAAASTSGGLLAEEISEYEIRDVARGRACVEPIAGVVAGVSPAGELLVRTESGVARARSGSLIFAEDMC